MPSKQYRVDRLAQEIQKDVDEILLKRVRDPRVQNVTITGVDVTGDLQQATIYYSILSDLASDAEKAQAGLDKATGLIRSMWIRVPASASGDGNTKQSLP